MLDRPVVIDSSEPPEVSCRSHTGCGSSVRAA
jgi:hypothetical protein